MSTKKYKNADINFKVTLEENNLPVGIQWMSSDGKNKEYKKCNAIAVSIWDPEDKNSYSIDLWTKEMTVPEMQVFFFQNLISIAETLENATGNKFIVDEMKSFCSQLDKKIQKEK